MKTFFYKASNISNIIPYRILSRVANQKTIFPFYHMISDQKDIVHIKHLYKVRNTNEFEKDLDFLLKHYLPIDFQTLLKRYENNEKPKRNEFLLTFDDGLREFHDVIAPILLKKGIPAVNFLNPSFIDNKDIFFRYKLSILVDKLKSLNTEEYKDLGGWFKQSDLTLDDQFSSLYSINYFNKHKLDELANYLSVDFKEYLRENKPYMSSSQIESLIQKGFSFGAHSLDHPQYSDLTIKDQIQQTKVSIEIVTNRFDLDYQTFSFPFTDYGVNKVYFDTVLSGQGKIADITFGCAGLKKDSVSKNIQRIPIEIDQFSAEQVIKGEHLYWLFKAFLNKNHIKR